MVAVLVQTAPQTQTGQTAEVPTIMVHVMGPNQLDVPMTSAAIVAACLGHGANGALTAGALPPASLASYHLTYLYPLLSGPIQVPELRWFKAKNILE
jgi:hypothetical protein